MENQRLEFYLTRSNIDAIKLMIMCRPETKRTYSLQSSMGYWVTRLARAMEADFEMRLADHNMTRASCAVLNAISLHGKTTPAELAAFIGIDGAAITRHLDRIVKQGLVSRRRSTQDRRSINLKITAKGAALVPKIAAHSMATNKKFLAGLTRSEREAMQAIIGKMLSNSDVVPADL